MHNVRKFVPRTRPQQLANTGVIELRMNVIDPNPSLGFCNNAWRKCEKRRRAYEFAPRQHAEG
jgi:hypothetical protein